MDALVYLPVQHSTAQRWRGWRGQQISVWNECKFLMQSQVRGDADAGCGAFGADVDSLYESEYSTCGWTCTSTCTATCTATALQCQVPCCWPWPIVRRQAEAATPPAAAAIRPHWPPEKLGEAKGRRDMEARPPGRYRYPRAAKGIPAGPSTRTCTYPLGPKRCYPPTLMRYKSPSLGACNGAPTLRAPLSLALGCHHSSDCDHTAGALLALLGKHGGSTSVCHSVTLVFLFFNFFAPARLNS